MARLVVLESLLFGVTLIALLFVPFPAEAVAASLLVLVVAILCLGVVAVLAAARGGADDLWVDRVPLVVVPPLAALTLWALSVPGADVFAAAIAVLIWLVVGVLLAVRVLALLARMPVRREPLGVWTCVLFVGLLVFAAGVWDVPLRARFALSENAMNEVAREVIGGERDPETIERIGLWNVDDVQRIAGGMRFTVRDAGFTPPRASHTRPTGCRRPGTRRSGTTAAAGTSGRASPARGSRLPRCPRARSGPRA